MLGYYWLVFTLVNFTAVAEVTVVERIGEDKRDSVSVKSLAVPCGYSVLRQKEANILQSAITLAVQLKSLVDNPATFFVYYHRLSPNVIKVADWRNPWVFPSAHFLAQTPPCVLGKRIHIVFALSKGDIEHELTLRCTLKPKGWEFESTDTPCIEEIDNPPAVHRITGKPVRRSMQK